MKRVLLLGAGHAHVQLLQALAREPMAGAEVALVTPHPCCIYSGMVPGVVAGHYHAEQCQFAVSPLAQAARVTLTPASAVALDAAGRKLTLSDGQVAEYELLSIDTGAAMDRGRVPGAREHALFVRPIEAFVPLLEGLWDLAARRVLDVVVVGGGAGGVELALALQHKLAGRGEEQARVALVTGGAAPLDGYAPAAMQAVAAALVRRRITVFRDTCAAIEKGALVLGSGARIACDAPVWATGADAPTWLRGSGLQLDDAGFVAVGATWQSSSHPEVFAVGDVATRVDVALPKSGVQAVHAAAPVLANLRRFVGGGELLAHTPRQRTLQLVSLGDKRAILAWGGAALEGRACWWLKDRIDRAWVARFTPAEPPAAALTRSA